MHFLPFKLISPLFLSQVLIIAALKNFQNVIWMKLTNLLCFSHINYLEAKWAEKLENIQKEDNLPPWAKSLYPERTAQYSTIAWGFFWVLIVVKVFITDAWRLDDQSFFLLSNSSLTEERNLKYMFII